MVSMPEEAAYEICPLGNPPFSTAPANGSDGYTPDPDPSVLAPMNG